MLTITELDQFHAILGVLADHLLHEPLSDRESNHKKLADLGIGGLDTARLLEAVERLGTEAYGAYVSQLPKKVQPPARRLPNPCPECHQRTATQICSICHASGCHGCISRHYRQHQPISRIGG